MTDVLALSLRGMQQDMARLERISLNLANATTPGYRREVAMSLPTSGGFADALDAAGGLSVKTDLRPGTLKATGQRLDVALARPGFFEVATDTGPAYTRQGDWHLDARGRLVTAAGDPVMGLGGEIVLEHPDPRIDANGRVFDARPDARADAAPVAQLKVVDFDPTAELQRLGGGLVSAVQPPTSLSDGDVELRQGFLENSNVSAMHEMVQLMTSMRHFESMQKVALGYDEMIGSAVRRLGDLS